MTSESSTSNVSFLFRPPSPRSREVSAELSGKLFSSVWNSTSTSSVQGSESSLSLNAKKRLFEMGKNDDTKASAKKLRTEVAVAESSASFVLMDKDLRSLVRTLLTHDTDSEILFDANLPHQLKLVAENALKNADFKLTLKEIKASIPGPDVPEEYVSTLTSIFKNNIQSMAGTPNTRMAVLFDPRKLICSLYESANELGGLATSAARFMLCIGMSDVLRFADFNEIGVIAPQKDKTVTQISNSPSPTKMKHSLVPKEHPLIQWIDFEMSAICGQNSRRAFKAVEYFQEQSHLIVQICRCYTLKFKDPVDRIASVVDLSGTYGLVEDIRMNDESVLSQLHTKLTSVMKPMIGEPWCGMFAYRLIRCILFALRQRTHTPQ